MVLGFRVKCFGNKSRQPFGIPLTSQSSSNTGPAQSKSPSPGSSPVLAHWKMLRHMTATKQEFLVDPMFGPRETPWGPKWPMEAPSGGCVAKANLEWVLTPGVLLEIQGKCCDSKKTPWSRHVKAFKTWIQISSRDVANLSPEVSWKNPSNLWCCCGWSPVWRPFPCSKNFRDIVGLCRLRMEKHSQCQSFDSNILQHLDLKTTGACLFWESGSGSGSMAPQPQPNGAQATPQEAMKSKALTRFPRMSTISWNLASGTPLDTGNVVSGGDMWRKHDKTIGLGGTMGNPMGNPMGNSMGNPMGNPMGNREDSPWRVDRTLDRCWGMPCCGWFLFLARD